MALFTMLSRRRVSPPYRLVEARVPPFGEGPTTVMAPKVLRKKLILLGVDQAGRLFKVYVRPRRFPAPKGDHTGIPLFCLFLRAAPSADEEDLTSHCAVTLAGRGPLLRPHLGVLQLFDNKPCSSTGHLGERLPSLKWAGHSTLPIRMPQPWGPSSLALLSL